MYQKKIAGYILDLQQRLGRGTFGEVYLAIDTSSNKTVAVKQIPISAKNQSYEKMLLQIQNEIKIMKAIIHPNVVQLFSVQQTTNNLYLVMEYCNQGTLEEYVKNKSNNKLSYLAEGEAKMFLKQIVAGFRELYRNRIVHRDLKLQNILINDGEAKIADFGFGKVMECDMESQLLKTYAGSPLYMSPQILNEAPYSSKCDIWSLGVIYFELLFGQPPWLAVSVPDLIRQVEVVSLKFPDKPKVSDQSKQLLQKMLGKEEASRISWEEMFGHQFFNEKMDVEQEQNLRLSLQKIEKIDDNLRKSSAKQKIYFENPVLQNVKHAAKEQKKMRKLFDQDSLAQSPVKQNSQDKQSPLQQQQQQLLYRNSEEQLDGNQYVQIFQNNKMEEENKKIAFSISDWIIHRRNKSVFMNTLSQKWFDLYESGAFQGAVSYQLYYKLLFILTKYQTIIFYKMKCRLQNKQLEKYTHKWNFIFRESKFTNKQWKLFVKSSEYKTTYQQMDNDFQIVKSFLIELIDKVKEVLEPNSQNQQILNICNLNLIDKQQFDKLFTETLQEVFNVIHHAQKNRDILVFATHLKNAIKKKIVFKYGGQIDFFKYYENIDNERTEVLEANLNQ